jgi:hypothetical protein
MQSACVPCTRDCVQLSQLSAYPCPARHSAPHRTLAPTRSATVYMAMCKRYNEVVAIKALNLEVLNTPMDDLVKEAAVMRAYHHPNVLPLHCAFVHADELWLVMPYCEGGSVAHILRYSHQEGLDEPLVAAIMKQVGSWLATGGGGVRAEGLLPDEVLGMGRKGCVALSCAPGKQRLLAAAVSMCAYCER